MLYADLDAAELHSAAELHARLKAQLPFPPWYGENLDALYDCLTSLPVDVLLTVKNAPALEDALGKRYAGAFLRVLEDAAQAGSRFRFLLPAPTAPEDGGPAFPTPSE